LPPLNAEAVKLPEIGSVLVHVRTYTGQAIL